MLDPDFFDKMEHVAREMKKEINPKFGNLPFGGIQVILCGDFFQLPPVSKKVRFLFQAVTWKSVIGKKKKLRPSSPVQKMNFCFLAILGILVMLKEKKKNSPSRVQKNSFFFFRF
jgi:hypothetical protein